ncbi:MAG: DNA-protecting protein DprA [Alphaproteobacteria bacterium]|nr:DNA-protecting protein DprA [Alphaproteobacteria bacterium]
MNTNQRTLTTAEKLDWLRLSRSENVGPITFFRLLEHYGSAAAALRALPDLARRGGRGKPIIVASITAVQQEMADLEALGGRLVAHGEPDYPAPLAVLEDAPPLLSVLGHLAVLSRPVVAIVGARNASLTGRKLARKIASDLGRAGIVVASGLARGIDAAAHEGALTTGTIAVNAGGVDIVYPPENGGLYQSIITNGAVISEIPLREHPQARHFPRRNRIVSGVSLGVVVVEAAARSGSLITARLAAEQGRELFAVPGSPLDPRSEGPHKLLREGATLVEGADDVIRELEQMLRRPLSEPRGLPFVYAAPAMGDTLADETRLEAARATIIEALGVTPVTVDEIIRECQLSPSVVSQILLELELAGRANRHSGNQVSLAM